MSAAPIELLATTCHIAQRVVPADFRKVEVALVVLTPALCVRNLLQDDQNADTREHALDHGVRHAVGDDAQFQHTQDELQQTGEHDGNQKGLVGTDPLNRPLSPSLANSS